MGKLSKPEDISDRGIEPKIFQSEAILVLGKTVHLVAECINTEC